MSSMTSKGLDTDEINCALDASETVSRTYAGCHAMDQLPVIDKLPCAMVVNSDSSDKPGTHWLAIYFDELGQCEFFDTFGLSETVYDTNNELKSYLTQFSRDIWRMYNPIQSATSDACGHFCVFFIVHRIHNIPANDIVRQFHPSNLESNDRKVRRYYNQYLYSHPYAKSCRASLCIQQSRVKI